MFQRNGCYQSSERGKRNALLRVPLERSLRPSCSFDSVRFQQIPMQQKLFDRGAGASQSLQNFCYNDSGQSESSLFSIIRRNSAAARPGVELKKSIQAELSTRITRDFLRGVQIALPRSGAGILRDII
jgi:hypothetical protein